MKICHQCNYIYYFVLYQLLRASSVFRESKCWACFYKHKYDKKEIWLKRKYSIAIKYSCAYCGYMADMLSIRRKTLCNQEINFCAKNM